DNDDGFDYPKNTAWEEHLEDDAYGIGKMLMVEDTQFTPMRLRLPPGLNVNDPSIEIKLTGTSPQSGVVRLWDDHSGGSLLWSPGTTSFTLKQLKYDPVSGGVTFWMQAITVSDDHDTKRDVDENGKPDDRLVVSIPNLGISKASPFLDGTSVPKLVEGALSDEVKYMVVKPNSFYPNLQLRREMKSALASQGVYAQADLPQFGLKLLDPDELADLRVPDDIIAIIGQPATVPGFKNGVYHEHLTNTYILAFAGTDDLDDIMVDIWQGLGGYTAQYREAMDIGVEVNRAVVARGKTLTTTGHSLGGGLSSAAAVAAGIMADTFNAAGLRIETLYFWPNGIPVIGIHEIYPGSVTRYLNAGGLIDAYYLDWDLLSFCQDGTPLQDAIGNRFKMDGPLDEQMAIAWAAAPFIGFAAQWLGGVPPVSTVAALGYPGYLMAKAHTSHYYL
ncbi:MAG: hypothetical protein KDA59_21535, partial [Planctomycetales bacterium]|nr:hypothetical protein [Planctomycetales bacterium]